MGEWNVQVEIVELGLWSSRQSGEGTPGAVLLA